MKVRSLMCAALLAASAGLAVSAPTIDGSYNSGTESEYSDTIWVNAIATQFGDNQTGTQDAGQDGGLVTIGNPEGVTTGAEFVIPLSAIGSPAGAFSMGGWINSGDRTFLSNQLIHDGTLAQNTANLGSAVDFTVNGFVPAASFTPVAVTSGDITVDGTLDAAYGTAQFVQNNYTQFGNATAGEADNANGSEIDAVYVASDGTNLYVFVAGNVEGNGNGLDLFFDTTAGGMATLDTSGSESPRMDTAISNRLSNQDGTVFGGTFAPDYYVTLDGINGAGLRVYYADLGSADPDLLIPGDGTFASDGTLTDPDAGAPAILATLDNSNTAGVPGAEIGTDLPDIPPSPAAPDVSFAYGSEINNLRFYIEDNRADMGAAPEVGEAYLYLFIGGNAEKNSNRLYLFFDSQAGGQNVARGDNVDIAFGALNRFAGMTWDEGFSPDQWLTINLFEAMDNRTTANYSESAVLRTDGPLQDLFFPGVLLDYASFDGGDREEDDGMGGFALTGEFPVDYGIDCPDTMCFFDDPFTSPNPQGPQSNYGPRRSQIAYDTFSSPEEGLILYALDNSNVGGVPGYVDGSEDTSDAANVNTGFEIRIDLAELGWDGTSDIKVGGMIGNSGADFMSNQVLGELPAATTNLGDPANIDFTAIAGDQFVTLVADDACPADINGDGFYNNTDINLFVNFFLSNSPEADINGDGFYNNTDINLFVNLFLTQCN